MRIVWVFYLLLCVMIYIFLSISLTQTCLLGNGHLAGGTMIEMIIGEVSHANEEVY